MFIKNSTVADLYPPILIGLIAFYFITGGSIIIPTNVDWLMYRGEEITSAADPTTQWLSWQFFRHSPILQLPLGLNPAYGMAMSSSIVFTDSLPLLALPLKYFNAVLPERFQYFGLWILACLILQAIFSYKLIALFTSNKVLNALGSILFIASPAMLARLGEHYALGGHWVLIAGLYLYFSRNFYSGRWLLLILLTALIHPYLLIMVMSIWMIGLWRHKASLKHCILTILCLLLTMWIAGYFIHGLSAPAPGFSDYGFDIVSLIGRKAGEFGDTLGYGVVLAVVIAAGASLKKSPALIRAPKLIIPIFILCTVLLIIALSNHIKLGGYNVFSYELPSLLLPYFQTFRYSLRFFWPVYYLIYLTTLYIIFKKLNPREAILSCSLVLSLQLIDTSGMMANLKTKYSPSYKYIPPMSAMIWQDIARQYKNIIYVLPENMSKGWAPLTYFAAMHKMNINTGYFARNDQGKTDKSRIILTQQIKENKLDDQSVYVFADDLLWQTALNNLKANDFATQVDGFKIIAPRFKKTLLIKD